MLAIDAVHARLGAAGDLADALAAGWDAFELVAAVADECADRGDGMFAAFRSAASTHLRAAADAVNNAWAQWRTVARTLLP